MRVGSTSELVVLRCLRIVAGVALLAVAGVLMLAHLSSLPGRWWRIGLFAPLRARAREADQGLLHASKAV